MKLLLALSLGMLSATAASAADPAAVRAAVTRAVSARLGAGVEIAIASLQVTATSQDGLLTARPEPAARLGRPSVFALTIDTRTGPRRIGSAVAVVTAVATCLQTTRALQSGDKLSAEDVITARQPIADGPLKPMPVTDEAIGARVVRSLPEGAAVTAGNIQRLPLVRSGQQVALRARVGSIEVRGIGIAVESGQNGSLIRVVNPDSRRTLVGRVVGTGEVEVVHGS